MPNPDASSSMILNSETEGLLNEQKLEAMAPGVDRPLYEVEEGYVAEPFKPNAAEPPLLLEDTQQTEEPDALGQFTTMIERPPVKKAIWTMVIYIIYCGSTWVILLIHQTGSRRDSVFDGGAVLCMLCISYH